MTTATTPAAWTSFQGIVSTWFHRPDFLALRACLATVKALDIATTPVWLMLIGPSGCGKSELYLRALRYPRMERTSDISLPGLMAMERGETGNGLLRRLGEKGLWIVSDFSSILGAKEEDRNRLTAAMREIFDGEYSRKLRGQSTEWKGRIHVVAACTPAVERFHRVHADLGERFLQVQIDRIPASRELRAKTNLQRRNIGSYHREVEAAASALLNVEPSDIQIDPVTEDIISQWSEFIARCRTVVSRAQWNGDITDLGYTEGPSRLYQQLTGLALGDATIFRQDKVNGRQLDLVERVALDSLPRTRRAVLSLMLQWPSGEEIKRAELQTMTGIAHNQTFTRTIEDLGALEILDTISRPGDTAIRLSPVIAKIVKATKQTMEVTA